MTTRYCALVQEQLDAFVDGELSGADRRDVLQHLKVCASCSRAVDESTAVGQLLRSTATAAPIPLADLSGLASGVISRTRAEAEESWQGWFRRATEDRHWFMVVGGAMAATFVTALFTSALLAFGPEPERGDSVAGFYADVTLASGVKAARQDARHLSGDAPTYRRAYEDLSAYEEEGVLVEGLLLTMTGPGGNRWNVDPTSQLIQEALLDEIMRLRLDEPMLLGRPASERVAVSSVISRRPAVRIQ
jgi:hypothetical protein